MNFRIPEPRMFKAGAKRSQVCQHLSTREMEVAILLTHGFYPKEMAAKLNLSIKTINTYVTRLAQKIGARSPVLIAFWMVKEGFVKLEDIKTGFAPLRVPMPYRKVRPVGRSCDGSCHSHAGRVTDGWPKTSRRSPL